MSDVIATKGRIADVILSWFQGLFYVWAAIGTGTLIWLFTRGELGMLMGSFLGVVVGLLLYYGPLALCTGLRSVLNKRFSPRPFK